MFRLARFLLAFLVPPGLRATSPVEPGIRSVTTQTAAQNSKPYRFSGQPSCVKRPCPYRNDTTVYKPLLLSALLDLTLNSNLSAATDDPPPVAGVQAVVAALMVGKAHVHLRYRYENVDDDLVPANDAQASTIRAALGWESGAWNGFSLFAEMEHISAVLADDYKEGPGPVDVGNARFPVVADPPGTELNQAYVKYAAPEALYSIKIGRQIMTYRDAPFHRFIGTVLWRQNWQTHDGVTLNVKPLAGLNLNYGYSA